MIRSSPSITALPQFTLGPALAPLLHPHLLGTIHYVADGTDPSWQPRQPAELAAAPSITVPLKGHAGVRHVAEWTSAIRQPVPGPRLPMPSGTEACMQLRCYSPSPVRAGQQGALRWRESSELLMGCLHIPLPASGQCAAAVRAAYAELFALLARSGKRHLVRIWNYVPRVTALNAAGQEIYRDFNLGRSQAFDASDYDTRHMPAATGIGCEGSHIAVAFLASTVAGLNFENPRQISAYRYPPVHGPRPPSFARATAWPHGPQAWLFISGTASIIGHQTVHIDDAQAQTRTALANVQMLLAERGATLADIELLTLYVRHARDVAPLARLVAQHLAPETPLLVTQADICRTDLLVEMEAIARRR